MLLLKAFIITAHRSSCVMKSNITYDRCIAATATAQSRPLTLQCNILSNYQLHGVSENIPDIDDCNLKKGCQISIIFDTNIPDTTLRRMTVQFPTSPNICFCTTCEKPNQRNITFLCKAALLLNQNNAQNIF